MNITVLIFGTMVFGAPLVSIRGFATSRPPLVVFTLCLTAFALTTLWLAYYVRTEEQIQSNDSHQDWKSLLNHLTAQELCIQHSVLDTTVRTESNHVLNNETFDWVNVSVNILATIDLVILPPNATYVHGYVPVSVLGWKSVCPTERPFSDAILGISFNLENVARIRQESEDREICVTLTGPRSILTMADSPPACNLSSTVQNSGSLISRVSFASLGERMDDGWCPDGIIARLTYKINPKNSVILSITDRSIINLHLVHTSYFLFVMAITLICYAVIRGKPKNKLTIDKVLLDP